MIEAVLRAPSFPAFLAASLVLALTPGPVVLYLIARTLDRGRRAGLRSVAGVVLGNLCLAAGASLGLAALLAVSAAAFTAIRLAGAGYLIWLGIRALRGIGRPDRSAAGDRTAGELRDGFLVAALNPKTALFFAAFLPQFIDPGAPVLDHSLGLGAVFVLIAAATDSAYVIAAGCAGSCLAAWGAARRAGRVAAAAVLIGLGMAAAVSGERGGR
ncbi:MAG TPA: LysE family translocator [Rhodocyclaceae bacterium]|nr:LysE family translocator [Rhodocyclaceae bacterium]